VYLNWKDKDVMILSTSLKGQEELKVFRRTKEVNTIKP
jgi:hypothetical protein